MSDRQDAPPDMAKAMQDMAAFWRKAMDTASDAGKTWTESMMPFMATRVAEGGFFGGAQGGGDISEAIKRMAQGPRLSDLWDVDRRVMETMAAWMEIRQRMATYQGVAAVPWQKTMDRYKDAIAAAGEMPKGDWRKPFSIWTAIANEELIANQRSEEFLGAQRDLLKSALQLRSRQQELADTSAKLLGLPTQADLDAITRELTELRRDFRAHVRAQRAKDAATPVAVPATSPKPAPAASSKAKRASATGKGKS